VLVRLFASLFLLLAAGFAADLRVSVVDPHSAAVAGARVAVYSGANTTPISIARTGGDGAATFKNLTAGEYRVEALAPGFAPQTVTTVLPQNPAVTLKLSLAHVAETVVVTATRSLVPLDEAAAEVSTVSATQLENLQPVSVAQVLTLLPGAIVNTAGQRGGQASLFVRGGESRYNKVIVDGVAVNDPGGTFDFGVLPALEMERIEFLRGAESTLYGSDAMTSVVQMWTRTGSTRVPELRFGADGGNFSTARGFASLAGARGRLDYNFFGEQFNTSGQGFNNDYSNALQGGAIGVALAPRALFSFRARHSNNRVGVPGAWQFNGRRLFPPDIDQRARQNNFLASAELSLAAPARWQHRFTGFEYHHRRLNVDAIADRGCNAPLFLDCDFSDLLNVNRAGLEYFGEYWARSWARTSFGYEFEVENGFVDQNFSGFTQTSHGLRRNHAVYAQELVTRGRLSLVTGARFVHNESFGNRVVPRVAAAFLARRGGTALSGTRLRFAYAEGIKAPRLEESFGVVGAFGFTTVPNPDLKPEENRSLEAGVQQEFAEGKYFASATYFHNRFRNRIDANFDPVAFTIQYVNVNRALAHGAEVELRGRVSSNLSLSAGYTYTATQILEAPLQVNPLLAKGAPLLRRPKHAGTLLASYSGRRWGSHLGGTFVGRRPDSDFLGLTPPITSAAGYARFDVGGWYNINRYVTAYVNVQNALNRRYEEVVGYPALGANVRAGMRFRLGGD
jgi:outer membrane cobalamin receptor